MNAAVIPRRAQARSSSGFARGGRADEDEVDGRVGREVVDRRARCRCRGSCRPRGSWRTPRPRSPGSGCCGARRTRTCRDGSTRRRPRRRAARTGRGSARRRASGRRSRRDLDERVDRDRPAVDDDQRVEVDAARRRVAPRRARASPRITATSASRSTAGSPRNGPSSAWVCEVVDQLLGVDRGRAARAGTRRRRSPRRGCRRCRASRVGPNCGVGCRPAMSSRLPRTIGATSRSTGTVVGRRGARAARSAACSTAAASARFRRTSPRSVLCAIASPLSLTTTG